jgi:3-hydroxyisobutyrate dehydrogenase
MSKQQVAFIGLGVMGYPMAGHLSKAGFQTKVYNRTTSKAKQWCGDYEGTLAETPAKAVEGADFVFICVGNDDDLRSVVYGEDGVLAGIKPGAILVDHTTASANVAREISEKAAVAFLMHPSQVVRRVLKMAC